ncbi:membrane protein [Fulvitalea axinellae]|uniref:Membrane protein n=1 Tax=Fulvitalea axinellae TaxID=1182444 RepID=A0AAU9CAP5_9BACT|nr:membrane protein [Fulvitalea axinellae]
MKRIVLAIVLASCLSLEGWATGYQALLQGNRELGMGNLGVALRPTASSVYWNPGALGFMGYNSVQAGVTFAGSKHHYRPLWSGSDLSQYEASTDSPVGTPFHVYATFGGENSDFRFGLGVYTPFGSSVKWEDGWDGRGYLTEMSLKTFFFQPTVSYKISDKFSVGAGFVLATGSVNLQKDITQLGDGATSEIDGSAELGYGYNIGVSYRPNEQWILGLSYKSEVTMKVEDGDAIFNVPMAAKPLFQADKWSSELPMPSTWAFGVTYLPTSKLSIGAEVNLVGWDSYEKLDIEFNKPVNGETHSVSNRNYNKSYVIKIGGEYQLKEWLSVRAGGYYDKSPVDAGYLSPETPDQSRINTTFGVGLKPTKNIAVDLAFLYSNGIEREQTPKDVEGAGNVGGVLPGTFKTTGLIGGISVSYNF